MLEHIIEWSLPTIISACELMGIFVVAVSALKAFWLYCKGLVTHRPSNIKFDLANGLATSLEFKMAAEILKTVLVRDLNELPPLPDLSGDESVQKLQEAIAALSSDDAQMTMDEV